MGPGEQRQKRKNKEGQTSLRVIQVSKKATETRPESHSAHEHSHPGWLYLTAHG